MTFAHLRSHDPSLQAACELVQDVVATVLDRLAPPEQALRRQGLTRRGLASRTGMSYNALMAVLDGQVFPRTDRLVRLATEVDIVLGVI